MNPLQLTKEAEEAMTQQSGGGGSSGSAAVRALIDGGKDRLKAEELGVYDGCTPRSMRNKQVTCLSVYRVTVGILRLLG